MYHVPTSYRRKCTGIRHDAQKLWLLHFTINLIIPIFLFYTVCLQYNNSVIDGKPPHLVIDTTQSGITSEAVKAFVLSLALPTISASYGQDGDIR